MAALTNSQYSELTNIYPRTGCLPALLLNYFAFVNSESSSHVNSQTMTSKYLHIKMVTNTVKVKAIRNPS